MTVLAFDFGEKRIGAAVGEPLTGIAHPLTTIHAADKQRRYAAIGELIHEWQPARLVVGLPAHMDGSEHALTRLARKFADDLGRRFGLPVELVDERLTTSSFTATTKTARVLSARSSRRPFRSRSTAATSFWSTTCSTRGAPSARR